MAVEVLLRNCQHSVLKSTSVSSDAALIGYALKCDQYYDETTCLGDEDCDWHDDGSGGYCDDGIPVCLENCEGISDQEDPDNGGTEFCNWITGLEQGDMGPVCAEDCDEDLEVNCFNYLCQGCLEIGVCDMVFGDAEWDDSLSYSVNLDKIQSVLEFLSNVKDIREQEAAVYKSSRDPGDTFPMVYSLNILIDNPNSNLRGFQFTINDVPEDFLHLYDIGGGITEEAGFETGFNPPDALPERS